MLVEGALGATRELSIPREESFLGMSAPPSRAAVERLQGNIGYIDLGQLQNHQVDAAFEELNDTTAIIFDMRGYPHGTAVRLLSHLTSERVVKGPRSWLPIALEPVGRGVHEYQPEIEVQPKAKRYSGKSVMLIDERAQSQSEFLAQVVREAHQTVFVGSPTAGANGNASNFFVPGGIWVVMSGDGIKIATEPNFSASASSRTSSCVRRLQASARDGMKYWTARYSI